MNDQTQQFIEAEKRISLDQASEFIESQIQKYEKLDVTFEPFLYNLKENVLVGGKWLRPTLTRVGYRLLSGRKEVADKIVIASIASELLHRCILIHDDIIDRDLQRHGKKTLEAKYVQELEMIGPTHPIANFGQAMAMISGVLLHSFVDERIIGAGLEKNVLINLIRALNECLTITVAGWRLETLSKQLRIDEVEEKQIEKAMWLVSANYSVLWPLRYGEVLAGTEYGQWSKALTEYGIKVGLGFQMIDDVLGMFGETKVTGKPVGADFREGKKTLLLHYAYFHANSKEKQFLEKNIGRQSSDDVISRVQKIMINTGALNWVTTRAKQYRNQGITALGALTGEKQKLSDLADFIIERNY